MPIFTDVDGEEIADKLGAFKTKVKGLKSEIAMLEEKAIEYARARDVTRIFGSEYIVSLKPYEKISLPDKADREKLIQVLKDIGKFDEVSKNDILSSKLKKIIKERQWPEEDLAKLEAFITKSESTKVSISKKKKE